MNYRFDRIGLVQLIYNPHFLRLISQMGRITLINVRLFFNELILIAQKKKSLRCRRDF
jgi:hypothetical protein